MCLVNFIKFTQLLKTKIIIIDNETFFFQTQSKDQAKHSFFVLAS
jgi:hypothetical protein